MPLPFDWALAVVAPPHKLLVRRAEQPLVRGRIIIPEGIRSATRASEATVVSVGAGITGYAAGDGLLLASSVGQGVAFGDRDEVKYALVDPYQVMGVIDGRSTETETATRGPLVGQDHPGRFVEHDAQLRALVEENEKGGCLAGWDEGDARGKR